VDVLRNYNNHHDSDCDECLFCKLAARTVNTAGIAGRNVPLVCNASVDKPVNWWYKDPWGSEEREVVVNGKVVNGNVYRMTLIGHNLVIHNAAPNDTGVYTCVEETGFGEHHKIALIVTGIVTFTLVYIGYVCIYAIRPCSRLR